MRNIICLSLLTILVTASLSAQEQSQKRLDSIIRYKFTSVSDSARYDKDEFNFDNNGNLILEAYYRWDSDEKRWRGRIINWNYDGKRIVNYSVNGMVLNELWFYWESYEGDWKLSRKIEHTYDDSMSLIQLEYYHLDEDQVEWILGGTKDYNYNENGDLVHVAFASDFGGWWMEEYSYNANGNLVLIINISESEGSWKEEYNYDVDGNLILTEFFRRDSDNDEWKQWRRMEDSYIESGNITLHIVYIADEEQLRLDKRFEYDYNETGLVMSEIESSWSRSKNDWKNSNKIVYTYDEYNNLMLSIEYNWDETNGWFIYEKAFYYNSTYSSGIEQIINNIALFPNPTSGIINITGLTQPAEVKIYSIQGQLLKFELQVENTIDISDLPTGVYLLNLSVENTVVKKTVVKR